MESKINTVNLANYFTSKRQVASIEAQLQDIVQWLSQKNWHKDIKWIKRRGKRNTTPKVQWGRIGLNFAEWNPGLFAGFIIDGSDHKVKPLDPKKGPDMCIIIDINPKIYTDYHTKKHYQDFKEKLKDIASKGDWIFYDHLADKPKNRWHPLYLRVSLCAVIAGTASFEEQCEKIYDMFSNAVGEITASAAYHDLKNELKGISPTVEIFDDDYDDDIKAAIVKICLLKRFKEIVSDDDMHNINSLLAADSEKNELEDGFKLFLYLLKYLKNEENECIENLKAPFELCIKLLENDSCPMQIIDDLLQDDECKAVINAVTIAEAIDAFAFMNKEQVFGSKGKSDDQIDCIDPSWRPILEIAPQIMNEFRTGGKFKSRIRKKLKSMKNAIGFYANDDEAGVRISSTARAVFKKDSLHIRSLSSDKSLEISLHELDNVKYCE